MIFKRKEIMLKIKDNIDLKELEKFGFEYNNMLNGYTRLVDKEDAIKKQCFVYVATGINSINFGTIPKIIYLCTPLSIGWLTEGTEWIVYDLIKADLVEEVKI